MRQTLAIHAALKRLIRSRGKTYADAALVLELSETSIKRLFARAELSVDRLERLCDWLGVDIADVVKLSEGAQPLVTELDSEAGEGTAHRSRVAARHLSHAQLLVGRRHPVSIRVLEYFKTHAARDAAAGAATPLPAVEAGLVEEAEKVRAMLNAFGRLHGGKN